LGISGDVRPLQGRQTVFLSFPWVAPMATHGMPLRGKTTQEGK
jgi:hypothetical protein